MKLLQKWYNRKALRPEFIAVWNKKFIENFTEDLSIIAKQKNIESKDNLSYVKKNQPVFNIRAEITNKFIRDLNHLYTEK